MIGPNNHYNYVFNYTDHLGNIRLSYGLDENNVLKILEENNYYPFGLKHNNYNVDRRRYEETILGVEIRQCDVCPRGYQYKYNGKELQDELGLNMYDYGARNYDPALGRWMNIDPLAEEGRRWSPYNYGLNNPIFFIDPDGMLSESFIKKMMGSASGTTWTNNGNGFTSNDGESVDNDGNQEDPKPKPKSKALTPEQENEKWRKYNESLIPAAENLITFALFADGIGALSELLTIKSAFKLTSLSGLSTKLLTKASKFTVASSKFDYFFGRVVSGNADNIRRSAQNLSDLTALGIKTESDLIKVFNKAYNNGSLVKTIETSHGVSIVKSASVGTQGQAVQVSFFYKGGNMNVTPTVSSIIPKL
jgi:RHS repeat-associated protein